ncbi:MAG: ribonuclease P protein component [Acidobacteria bacterium]|nr:ribonuclease P protein component [Acidobacteriota bacterium]MCB9378895.1 ribonuclease P protein component [Holophagales bacterium]
MPPAPPADQRLPRHETLRKSADYRLCYRGGRRRAGAFAVYHQRPNGLDAPRLGITASRKVGRAVVRNRLKRWIRECYRRSARRSALPPVDIVVHLRSEAAGASFAALSAELDRAFVRIEREARR